MPWKVLDFWEQKRETDMIPVPRNSVAEHTQQLGIKAGC